MEKFRKKPIVIEAIQFTGENGLEIEKLSKEHNTQRHLSNNQEEYLTIKTLEGIMTASKGDWIIKGVNGELYPCKPDIFEKTYTQVIG